jgi:hypothetical protein
MNWVWDQSESRHGARLVLLAIADCASGDGRNAWPSVAEIKRKAALGERAVQTALAELVKLGELEIRYNAGPKGCNRYRVIMDGDTPAESAPPQNLHPPARNAPPQKIRGQKKTAQVKGQNPAESAPSPAESAPPQISTETPAESAPVTVLEPSENSPTESSSSQRKRGTRIPAGFIVTEEMAQWARETVPVLIAAGRGMRETEKFINYWQSKTGKDATKLDWPATWRNWMLNAEERMSVPAPADRREQAHQARTSRAMVRAAAREANS